MWKIMLEYGVWLADGLGEPSCTLVEDNALLVDDMPAAQKKLKEARRFLPFKHAAIIWEQKDTS